MGFLVLMGAPGAGKGTQAARLSESLSLPHISSGDLFREHLREQTDLGRQAQGFINRGELVPDEITIAMVRRRLEQPDCRQGCVLDGFPRTQPQAEALDGILADMGARVDHAVLIQVKEKQIIDRMAGRRVCRAQSHVYHLTHHPPKQAGICDIDGSELYQREDDQPTTISNRFRVFEQQTGPVIRGYQERGILLEVDGHGEMDEVAERVMHAVGETKVGGHE